MAAGAKIGKYEILSKLGEGGMGAVYKAKHPTLDRFVIIKELKVRGSTAFVDRFKREARIMIDFREERICQAFDHFKEGASYYIAMEYIDGISLEDLLKQKRYLASETALLIYREICYALKYAHDRDVIHRDIKPANVLISKDGVIKLLDFGIATSKDDADENLTRDGTTLGTPAYMSPEQIRNSKNVDKSADIYSMGVMLYEMTTGTRPYPGSFTPETISLICKGKYKKPEKVNPNIVPVVKKIIKKAMKVKQTSRFKDLGDEISLLKRPLKKYRSQEEINETIRCFVKGEEPKNRKKSSTEKAPSGKLKKFLKFAFALIILATLLAGGSYYAYKAGYYHEYLKAEETGALKITVRIPKEYQKQEDFYLKASLYDDETNRSRKKPDAVFTFNPEQEKKDPHFTVLSSPKKYLKAGNYTVAVNIENESYFSSFYLQPRINQKKLKESYLYQNVTVDLKPSPKLPLKLVVNVIDSVSRREITAETDLYIDYNGLKKWNDFVAEVQPLGFENVFTTGRRYNFTFMKDNYFTRNFTEIQVEPYQSVLYLNVELEPNPGIMEVDFGEQKGIELLLNNSDRIFSAGKDKKLQKLESSSVKSRQVIHLNPGDYFITVKKGSAVKTENIKLESNQNLKIKVIFNESGKQLSFDITR